MKPEILAPVGGKEQLVAAVRAGANAVYFGTKNMNARRNANNFSNEELIEAVSYAHASGVKVYITLNTLVFDDELSNLENELKVVAAAGADAIIVQDLAVASFVRKCCPDIDLHASTQMCIHNVWGVEALKRFGFTRAVLARELSLEEISKINRSVPDMELEVFVHGALCMSVSGMCYLSSIIGERSGNRGLCAQPCRLNFRCNEREYALSLKDMSYVAKLNELCAAGVTSLKIEGRMKRPEYVAASVNACKMALEGLKPDLETLKAVFSRSGFTDGYLTGKRNISMFGVRTKDDVVASSNVLKKLSNLYKSERPAVKVDMKLFLLSEKSILEVSGGGEQVEITFVAATLMSEHALNKSQVCELLSKTGGTIFIPGNIEYEAFEGAMLPFSVLNKARRQALEELYRALLLPRPKQYFDFVLPDIEKIYPEESQIWGQFTRFSQICFDDIFDRIILPLEEVIPNSNAVLKFKDKLIVKLPDLAFDEYSHKIKRELEFLKETGFNSVMCGNIGILEICKSMGFELHGGFGLNITNSISIDEYVRNYNLLDAVVSFEMSMSRIVKLKNEIPIGVIGYGYLPLMRFRACPLRDNNGCGKCKGGGVVTDRLGNKFSIVCHNRQYSTLLNSIPICISDKEIKADFTILCFNNNEKESEIKTIIDLFKKGNTPEFKRTNGLYFRKLK